MADIVLVPYREEHIHAAPMVQQSMIAISTVCNHNAVRRYGNVESSLVVCYFSVGDIHKLRQQGVVIKQRVHLYLSFHGGIMRPVMHRERQRHQRGAEHAYGHLETEAFTLSRGLLSEMPKQHVKDVAEHRTVATSVLIGYCWFGWHQACAKMI